MAPQRLRLGFQVWGQYVTWPELMAIGHDIDELGFDELWSNDHFFPQAAARGRGAGLPRRPGLRGLVDPVRLGRRDQSGADGLPRLGRRVSEPGAAREDGDGPGPRDGRPGRPGSRRRLVRAGAPGVRVRVPAPRPAARPDGGGRRDLSRPPRRGVRDPRRPVVLGGRCAQRSAAASRRGCRSPSGERGEAHAPVRGRARGHLERGPGLARVVPPAERDPRRALPGRRSRPGVDRADRRPSRALHPRRPGRRPSRR